MKTVILALILTSTLFSQAPIETKKGATPDMVEEVDRLNRVSNQKNYISGSDNDILVYFDPAMSWGVQAKMYRSSVAKTFKAKGIVTVIVWNGKDAWKGSTEENGTMETFKGPLPLPSLNHGYTNLPGIEEKLAKYNEGRK